VSRGRIFALHVIDQRAALLQIRPNTMVQIEGRLSDHGQLLGLSIRDATLPPGR